MAIKSNKQSRFRRGKAEPIELTERDVLILQSLYKYRFLSTDHLMVLTGTESKWGMNDRMRKLFCNKYVDRPKAQKAIFSHASKRPMIHALGNEGAKLLSQRFNIPMPPSVYWTEKNRRVREKHIEHTLGISDFMVGIEKTCSEAENLRFIDRQEILAGSPSSTKKAKHPWRWRTQISHGGDHIDISIEPDCVFGIEFLDRDEGKNKVYFFVEIDRGTMPILRKKLDQTSFFRKMLSYANTRDKLLALDRFGIPAFRVLTVTTSEKRIATMQNAFKSEMASRTPAGMFLFAKKVPFGKKHEWVKANGDEVGFLNG